MQELSRVISTPPLTFWGGAVREGMDRVWQTNQVKPPHAKSRLLTRKRDRNGLGFCFILWQCGFLDIYKIRLYTLYNHNPQLTATMVTISRANKSHIKSHHMKIPVKTLLSTVVIYLKKKMIGPNKKQKKKTQQSLWLWKTSMLNIIKIKANYVI